MSNTVKTSVRTAIAANFPMIVPASAFGKNAPSNLINVASIGCGRISITHDMMAIARYSGARIRAVCDVDKNRAAAGPAAVRSNYEKAGQFNGPTPQEGCTMIGNRDGFMAQYEHTIVITMANQLC